MSNRKVVVLVANGSEDIEVVTAADILRRGGLEVSLVSIEQDTEHGREIKCYKDTRILCDDVLAESYDAETLVLPGGMEGTHEMIKNRRVQELIKEFNRQKKLIGAISAAPLALMKAGVLPKEMTCLPALKDEFQSYTTYVEQEVVVSGNIVTSAGPATAIAFALGILELLDPLKAKAVANDIAYKK